MVNDCKVVNAVQVWGRVMRLIVCATAVMLGVSGSAFAQNSPDQPSNSANTKQGTVGWQAPIGHRQPTLKTLPPDVLQQEQAAPSSGYEKYDKRTLEICKGC